MLPLNAINMDHHKIKLELERNRQVFKNLLQGLPAAEYLWKPAPGKWCLLEIVCHLYDEEREDFRARIIHVLDNKSDPLPSIDPPQWVINRKYIEQDYGERLNMFLDERLSSVQWLRSLENPQWDKHYNHPKFGNMSAAMFLSNWLAHDYLHFKQIIKLRFDRLKDITGEDLNYAGEWK